MNLSMKWLSDYIKADIDIKDFCHGMTMSGSKVEGYEKEGEEITNVVVGKISEITNHENSDHLLICQIDIGKENLIQIVTGANNIKVGDLVPVALDGSNLPNGVKIKKGKLRGVESHGMLCSIAELNLTQNDFPYAVTDGIFIIQEECEIGEDIHSAVGINDTSVEFEITSNRPDCLSVIGLAREASATFDLPLSITAPQYNKNNEDIKNYINVEIENTDLCKRYSAGIVTDVKIEPSPRWMRERLRASGIRPINNLVDITNYVMLEYGQPMHAFDLKYVENSKIIVRNAKENEQIMTLDGVERTLSPEMLIIADGKKPIAVAGVMGGEHSGIMSDTNTVVFESAYFEPVSVRTTAKKLGMRTDSSSRFEKGLDQKGTVTALERAFELVEKLGAGKIVGSIIDIDNTDNEANKVEFNPEWINSFLGTNIPKEDMIKYLEKLDFKVDGNSVIAPSFRIDIECKADIAEEIARIFGYNSIPSKELRGLAKAKLTDDQKFIRNLENTMTSIGCYQIMTYSFTSPKCFEKINLPLDSTLRKTVTITNPLGEDTSIMRTTIIPSMLEILSRNYNNRNEIARLFEIGNEYIHTSDTTLPEEPLRLAIGMYGSSIDFYDLKGCVEAILDSNGICDVEYERISTSESFEEKSAFHPGRSAVLLKDGKEIGILGEIHPIVSANYEIETKVYVAKIKVPELISISKIEKTYTALPKYPATTRDLSLLCDDFIPVASLEKIIKNSIGNILEKITLFNVYKGKQIEEGKKSVSFSMVLRSHNETLTDEHADKAMKKTLKELSQAGAELRL